MSTRKKPQLRNKPQSVVITLRDCPENRLSCELRFQPAVPARKLLKSAAMQAATEFVNFIAKRSKKPNKSQDLPVRKRGDKVAAIETPAEQKR
jgi:hypothetical protein